MWCASCGINVLCLCLCAPRAPSIREEGLVDGDGAGRLRRANPPLLLPTSPGPRPGTPPIFGKRRAGPTGQLARTHPHRSPQATHDTTRLVVLVCTTVALVVVTSMRRRAGPVPVLSGQRRCQTRACRLVTLGLV